MNYEIGLVLFLVCAWGMQIWTEYKKTLQEYKG